MTIQYKSLPEAQNQEKPNHEQARQKAMEVTNLEKLVQNTMVEVYRVKDKIASKAQLNMPSTPKEPLCPS